MGRLASTGTSIVTSTGAGGVLALQLPDRLGDDLAVEVEADGGDVAGLLGAEQVAGAADLEVAHGDLETRAQVGGLADRLAAARRPPR